MNKFYLSTNLITNFKPQILDNFDNFLFFKKNKNQIFCRNFFLFLLLIKYKKINFIEKSSIFIKPFKRKVYTILRSPYRHKLTRHQIILNRYEIISSIIINIKNPPLISNFNATLNLMNILKKFNVWFESNLIFNHRSKISFNFFYKNNFLLNKFFTK